MRTYLFYIHALAGGGAERVWCVLASALAEKGHRVIMAVDYHAEANRAHLSPAVRLYILGGSHVQNVLRLGRLLRQEQPDVAIAALAASNLKLTAAAALAGRLGRTILSYHGYAESEPQKLSQLGFLAAPVLTRLTARTVCVSDGLLGYMRRRWGASTTRTLRIYNPVAVQNVPVGLTAGDLRRRPPVIAAVGRLVSYKNFAGLVRAFAQVAIPDARLVIMGEGGEREAIERDIRALGLENRVSLLGYVADPAAVFATARCFALTSRSETFGLVVVEALAHGLAVVATRCDGPAEILVRPELGVLVPQDDPVSLADALTAALTNPGEPAARMQHAKTFSVSAAMTDYEHLLESICRDAPRGRSRFRRRSNCEEIGSPRPSDVRPDNR